MMTNIEITPPVQPRNIFLVKALILLSPNVVSIVASSVNIDTQAAARVIVFDAK